MALTRADGGIILVNRRWAAADLPGDVARGHIAGALAELDDAIREIRGFLFTDDGDHAPPSGS